MCAIYKLSAPPSVVLGSYLEPRASVKIAMF